MLILILAGDTLYPESGKTNTIVEFNSLSQCQYTYKILSEQIAKSKNRTVVVAGGCFEK